MFKASKITHCTYSFGLEILISVLLVGEVAFPLSMASSSGILLFSVDISSLA